MDSNLDKIYDPSRFEPVWYPRWLEADAFTPLGRATHGPDISPYVVLLPPPNVTGVLHMGHILSSTLQDVFVRFHRMRGRETLWWPGTDHAGIATQKIVEKKLREAGHDPGEMSRKEFLEHCWKWKESSHQHIVKQAQRIGWSLDWPREYFTLDEHMSAAVVEVFIRLYNKGLIYRGEYITNWCPLCTTAISDEEVEHVEVAGKLWTVRYPRTDGDGWVEVSTTRPETILGDVAVAIHPDDARAASLVGRKVRLPVLGREIPIIADPYVDPEFGTGMVKITPAHDANDFQVGQRHGLPMPVVIDPEGRMNNAAGPYAGQDRSQARKGILAQLEREGLLVRTQDYPLAQARHDRCGTVIEPRLSKQWFVRMKPLAGPAIRVVEEERVRFYPERWRNVYLHWMRNIQDWCISRQLRWGHRIPVYTCDACSKEVALHATAHAAPTCSQCGSTSLRQDEDVLDTWFSSWLVPFSPMGWPDHDARDLARYHPTTMLVTGPDIIFFWVARMIVASLEFAGDVPFHTVLLHGILRDTKGRKMSKSLGNSPEPMELMERYGADALRFATVMLSPPGQDTFFDEKSVETGRNFANKVWNAARLVLTSANERGWVEDLGLLGTPSAATPDADGLATLWHDTFARALPESVVPGLRLEDRWILDRFTVAVDEVNGSFEALRANDAAARVYHFFWDEFCAWYLEAIKPRVGGSDSASSRAAHAVALVLLARSCALLSPFMPFLAEELWSRIPGTGGLVTTAAYPVTQPDLRDPDAVERFGLVIEAASAVRTLRSEMNVPPGRKAPAFVHSDTGDIARWDGETIPLLCLYAKLESLEALPASARPAGAASVVVRDFKLVIPLGALIDVEAERARLQRDLERVEAELRGVTGKLANANFVERAPASVVEHERNKHRDLTNRREQLQNSLAELTGMG